MRAYALDLRQRIINFIEHGATKAEATRRFNVARRTVYRYLNAAKEGNLKPKTTWGGWTKLNPKELAAYVKKHPDLTLKELQEVFSVSHNAIYVRLKQLGFTLKKSKRNTASATSLTGGFSNAKSKT